MRRARIFVALVVLLALAFTFVGPVRADAPAVLVVEESASAAGSAVTAWTAPVAATLSDTASIGAFDLPDGAVVRAPAFAPAASYATEGAALAAVRAAIEPGLGPIEAGLAVLARTYGRETVHWQYRSAVRCPLFADRLQQEYPR